MTANVFTGYKVNIRQASNSHLKCLLFSINKVSGLVQDFQMMM